MGEGVYATDIDWRQQKVVVTGNVEGETLVKKLMKTGKHAELWPQPLGSKGKKQATAKNTAKSSDPESGEPSRERGDDEKEADRVVEVAIREDATKHIQVEKICHGIPAGNDPKAVRETVASVAAKNDVHFPEWKLEGKQTGTLEMGVPPPVTPKKAATPSPPAPGIRDTADPVAMEGGSGKNNGGIKSHKKKKTRQKENPSCSASENPSCAASAEVAASRSAGLSYEMPRGAHVPHFHPPASTPSEQRPSPPRPMYPRYPTYSYEPPSHSVHYYAPNPNSSSAVSRYISPPRSSCHYVQAQSVEGSDGENSPSHLDPYSLRPPDSFEFFSDENPNGCSLM